LIKNTAESFQQELSSSSTDASTCVVYIYSCYRRHCSSYTFLFSINP